jgi:hypothetical protein
MEESIALLDFETVDQMIQVHGVYLDNEDRCLAQLLLDYEGVSMSSRTPASKNAASEASSIFQGHYPEFLVRLSKDGPTGHSM